MDKTDFIRSWVKRFLQQVSAFRLQPTNSQSFLLSRFACESGFGLKHYTSCFGSDDFMDEIAEVEGSSMTYFIFRNRREPLGTKDVLSLWIVPNLARRIKALLCPTVSSQSSNSIRLKVLKMDETAPL